ncbi:MAG: hypothetical protein IT447_01245 [Phycisphaerales bacterium]|jgi:hypothetical protein|nr:hypothetical protein [Phycisphaerales bacterium]
MRGLLAVPLVVAGIGLIAWAAFAAAGWTFPVRAVLVSAGIGIVSGELALVPLLLAKHGSQATMSQAGLAGTTVQLLVGIGMAAVAIMGRFPLGGSLIYWLLLFYWVTLMVVVVAYVRAVKAAPMTPPAVKS